MTTNVTMMIADDEEARPMMMTMMTAYTIIHCPYPCPPHPAYPSEKVLHDLTNKHCG